jgi:uncharacterized protein involved in copper resistance
MPRLPSLTQGRRWTDFGGTVVKKLVELLICIIHPLAVVLMWINLAGRRDLSPGSKIVWAVFGLIPLVPFLYVLTGGALF